MNTSTKPTENLAECGNKSKPLLPLVVGGLTITCEDNMALMSRYPDNYFDLAIVDPPYGMEGNKYCTINKRFVPTGYKVAEIDRGGATGFSLGNRPTK